MRRDEPLANSRHRGYDQSTVSVQDRLGAKGERGRVSPRCTGRVDEDLGLVGSEGVSPEKRTDRRQKYVWSRCRGPRENGCIPGSEPVPRPPHAI